MSSYEKELQAAREVAVRAGKKILEIYLQDEPVETEYKADSSPLTRADKESDSIIVPFLKERFPAYAVLSEEEKDDPARLSNDYCFIVDPLDGTKEFLKRNGQFTVNIALAYRHRVVMGVICVPVTGELYYAASGEGAYYEKPGQPPQRLQVSGRTAEDGLILVESNSHSCAEMDDFLQRHRFTETVKVGSSLKGCMVASARADLYYRFNPTMEWDTAAMQCIAEEAGAVFRCMDDTEMLYNRTDCRNSGFYIINRPENRLY